MSANSVSPDNLEAILSGLNVGGGLLKEPIVATYILEEPTVSEMPDKYYKIPINFGIVLIKYKDQSMKNAIDIYSVYGNGAATSYYCKSLGAQSSEFSVAPLSSIGVVIYGPKSSIDTPPGINRRKITVYSYAFNV